jgi:KDO2-lipid IV(A) lauroyltransferase
MPIDAASAVGGLIGRVIGPFLPMSRYAVDNLRAAFADMTYNEITRIVRGMWDNIGRTFAEYPHIEAITKDVGMPGARIAIRGWDVVATLRAGGPALLFTGHLANWELMGLVSPALRVHASYVYRDPNNPYVSWLLRKARRVPPQRMIPKGAEGARRALTVLRRGEKLGMLVDQKMNDGIAIPFFGRDAMTAPALARFALRFRCPVVPVHVERIAGARFCATFEQSLEVVETGNRDSDVEKIMTRVNQVIEGWIRERPDQWLWIHRRWPDARR